MEEPESGPGPDPRVTAAAVAAVSRRAFAEQPVASHGDELELVASVLAAWGHLELDDQVQLQALSAAIGFLPSLVLARFRADLPEIAESIDDWLVSFDPEPVMAALERLGIPEWCRSLGAPLDLTPALQESRGDPTKRVTSEEALSFIRRFQKAPSGPAEELEGHALLDRAVAETLPVCRDALDRIRSDEDLSPGRRDEYLVASFRLLTMCRFAGVAVNQSIAWSPPDPEGFEAWGTYLMAAMVAGLNLRLLAEPMTPAERSELLFLDDELLEILAERLEGIDLDLG